MNFQTIITGLFIKMEEEAEEYRGIED